MFSFEFPRAHREVVRDSNVEIVRDFDSRGRATDVWFRFNNYVVFALEVKHDQLGRIHQWRRKVGYTRFDALPVSSSSLSSFISQNTANTLHKILNEVVLRTKRLMALANGRLWLGRP